MEVDGERPVTEDDEMEYEEEYAGGDDEMMDADELDHGARVGDDDMVPEPIAFPILPTPQLDPLPVIPDPMLVSQPHLSPPTPQATPTVPFSGPVHSLETGSTVNENPSFHPFTTFKPNIQGNETDSDREFIQREFFEGELDIQHAHTSAPSSELVTNHPDPQPSSLQPLTSLAPDMAASSSRSPKAVVRGLNSPRLTQTVPLEEDEEYEEIEDEYHYPTDANTIPPIVLHLPDSSSRHLFNVAPSGQENENLIAWCKGQQASLAEASLADVWAALRTEMVKEGSLQSGEMVVMEKQMELQMGEVGLLLLMCLDSSRLQAESRVQDDLHLQTITLLELVQLHHGCGLLAPVRLYITFLRSRFIQRYNAILKEVSAQADEEKPDQEPESENVTIGQVPKQENTDDASHADARSDDGSSSEQIEALQAEQRQRIQETAAPALSTDKRRAGESTLILRYVCH